MTQKKKRNRRKKTVRPKIGNYTKHVPDKLPEKYDAGFIDKLDKRTNIYQALKLSYDNITNDLGGQENLSHIQLCMVERFVFMEFVLRGLEEKMATNPKSMKTLLSRWIQAINSLSGLARNLGLKRVVKKVDLDRYIEAKNE